ncbi:hypothetical protein CSOJ01_12934 [Colletotrichum sojae]|uniref:Uncharacterized protein n=1 Tax=Colletotrichum sojae TaxID=2175907 RepID=A0A8H6ITK3_9PEZI|nr:hypothetical protein CSOJ01_12934 [Colletotrichum sojae]
MRRGRGWGARKESLSPDRPLHQKEDPAMVQARRTEKFCCWRAPRWHRPPQQRTAVDGPTPQGPHSAAPRMSVILQWLPAVAQHNALQRPSELAAVPGD